MHIAPLIQLRPMTTIDKKRSSKIPADIRVRIGQKVNYDTIIGETEYFSDHVVLDIAQGLGTRKELIADTIAVRSGDQINSGDLIAGPVGIAKRVVRSPLDGHVVLVHENKVVLKAQSKSQFIHACMPGEIVEIIHQQGVVIRTRGGRYEGVWGNGRIGYGTLRCITHPAEISPSNADDGDIIFFVNFSDDAGFLEILNEYKPKGMVIGSIAPFLLPIIKEYPYPVMLLLGFSVIEINSKSINSINQFDGYSVTLDAEPTNWYSVDRPELIIPRPDSGHQTDPKINSLQTGQEVRIIGHPHSWESGRIVDFVDFSILPNGIQTKSAVVKISDNNTIEVPITNLEIIY